jgi:menaquinone-9 beta-reductase
MDDDAPLPNESRWDVLVVGCGPAGTATAIPLVRRGLRVLLVDQRRFPRDKVCGGCLNLGALRQLADLGLADDLAAAGAVPLQRFALSTDGRQAAVDLEGGRALTRSTLDELLRNRAVREGVQVRTGTRAGLGGLRDSAREVVLDDGRERVTVEARIVVVAAGLAGQQFLGGTTENVVARRSRVGLGCVLEGGEGFATGTIHMAVGREGYVGVARGEAGRLMVAAALGPECLRGEGAADVCRRLLARNGWPLPDAVADEDWRGTIQLTRRRIRPAAERLFFVGDAAGYVEPFTGEGIGWALEGGRQLAPLVERSCRGWDDALGDEWTRTYRRAVGRRQWTCRALATMLRSPRLVRLGTFVARRFPRIVRPVVQHLRGIDARP